MDLDLLSSFLGWCTLINYGVLMLWFLAFAIGRTFIRRLHGTWFHLDDARFDSIHYAGMAVCKILILVFNLVPWIVLQIIR